MLDWLRDRVGRWARPAGDEAAGFYGAIAGASRNPGFYAAYGVADSVDGRFDALMLHAALVVRRLAAMDAEGGGGAGGGLAQAVVDTMFAELDLSLHEMGAGENKVGGGVKTMARAWLGRQKAYGAAIAGNDRGMLAAALARNLYRGNGAGAPAGGLADAVLRAAGALDALEDDALTPAAAAGALALVAPGALGRQGAGGGEARRDAR